MHLIQLFHSIILANMVAGYLVPNPPGRYNVTLTTGTITDYNRDGRALMLSIFQPTTCTSTVPVQYMPEKTAEYQGPWTKEMFDISADLTPLLLEARLPVCQDDHSSCSLTHNAPVILISPGYRGTRLYYNIIASAIASKGFMVITMDHPGETNIITYPDGHAVYSYLPNTMVEEMTPYAYARASDAAFIIDQLSNATAMAELLPQYQSSKSTTKVAMLGHSLGGAAAVLAAGFDSRIRAIINLDGPFIGSLHPSGLSQPVLYVATEREYDPTWSGVWPELKGPKLWIKVANLSHEGMLDLPTLLEAAGQNNDELAGLLGTMAPAEWLHILTTYTTEWVNRAFAGKVGGPLLEGQELDKFPEISILRRENF